ncbi:TPA: flagellar biosynthesis protein FlgB [Shigella flexneri]|uniref:flagellar biosynthesis protein FlgB n=1 Tax=Shigella flexneri TaxID=623 RepID=UPI00094AE0FE|nr:flagellar biosynthesis protein FlgB [Shigella flexneri]EFQ0230168.1 flagellar biosynthesis protein FlgB [Shigella flexneri]EFV7178096.1 flagellar biosynthesis protein FlgB [Shigella flexneri]EFW7324839.1 flagellar biosynthesis protein FlgB [Shigella flexneri]EFX0105430.1 flagellar biosynthesis protein FlgB [Shigella flexneri]EFX5209075.1 flagellar biosynthesis protein FlgB [Shigella flexneri]
MLDKLDAALRFQQEALHLRAQRQEVTQFADNSLQYQMSLSALSGQIKGMMNVLQSGN